MDCTIMLPSGQKLKITPTSDIDVKFGVSVPLYACPICSKPFQNPSSLQRHVKMRHSERTLQMVSCNNVAKENSKKVAIEQQLCNDSTVNEETKLALLAKFEAIMDNVNVASSSGTRQLPIQQITLLNQIREFRNPIQEVQTWKSIAYNIVHSPEEHGYPISAIIGYSEASFRTYIRSAIVSFEPLLDKFSYTTRCRMRGGDMKKAVNVPRKEDTVRKYSSKLADLLLFILRVGYSLLPAERLRVADKSIPAEIQTFMSQSIIYQLWSNQADPSIREFTLAFILTLRNSFAKRIYQADDTHTIRQDQREVLDRSLSQLVVRLFTAATDNVSGGYSLVQVWLALTQMGVNGEVAVQETVTQDISAIFQCFFASFAYKMVKLVCNLQVEENNQKVNDAIADYHLHSSAFTQLVTLRALVQNLGPGTNKMPCIHWRDETKLIFQIEDDKLSLSTLKDIFTQLCKELSEILFRFLLFGICDDWLTVGDQLKLCDNMADCDPGITFVTQNKVLQDLWPRFQSKLMANQAFLEKWTEPNKPGEFSTKYIGNYRFQVEEFMNRLLAAGKLSEGLPSRGTEQIDWTWINEGPHRKRTIYLYQGHFALISGYWKSREHRATEKIIARFYPFFLSRLVILYYSICIPFQKFLVGLSDTTNYDGVVPNISIPGIKIMETTFMSVNGNVIEGDEIAKRIRRAISNAHKVSGKIPDVATGRRERNESESLDNFGIRKYRHVVIAIMRLLDGQESIHDPLMRDMDITGVPGEKEDDEEDAVQDPTDHNQNLAQFRARQAGHTIRTHNKIYGIGGQHTSSLSCEALRDFFSTSSRWHTRMGVPPPSGSPSPYLHSNAKESLALLPVCTLPCIPEALSSNHSDNHNSTNNDDIDGLVDNTNHDDIRVVRFQDELNKDSDFSTLIDGVFTEKRVTKYLRKMLQVKKEANSVAFRNGHQRDAVFTMLNSESKNVFYHATTSGGKTFAALLTVFVEQSITDRQELHSKKFRTTVMIVPFTLLKQDIEQAASKFGVKCVMYNPACPIQEYCQRNLILASTNQAVTGTFRNMLLHLERTGCLRRIIIDEVHEVMVSKGYREEMEKLCRLRDDPLHLIPICAMSATVPIQEQQNVLAALGCSIDNTTVIRAANCDRPNLEYNIIYFDDEDGGDPELKLRSVIIDWLIKEQDTNSKMMVFFPYTWMIDKVLKTIIESPEYLNLFEEGYGSIDVITKYHNKCGDDVIKLRNWSSFAQADGHTRILFGTSGAGAGVNAPNVNCIIEYGAGSSVLTSIQKFGRACREDDSCNGRCMIITSETFIESHRNLLKRKGKTQQELNEFETWIRWVVSKTCKRNFLIEYMDGPDASIKSCPPRLPCSHCRLYKQSPPSSFKKQASTEQNKTSAQEKGSSQALPNNAIHNTNGATSSNNKRPAITNDKNGDDDDDDGDDFRKHDKKVKSSHEVDEEENNTDNLTQGSKSERMKLKRSASDPSRHAGADTNMLLSKKPSSPEDEIIPPTYMSEKRIGRGMVSMVINHGVVREFTHDGNKNHEINNCNNVTGIVHPTQGAFPAPAPTESSYNYFDDDLTSEQIEQLCNEIDLIDAQISKKVKVEETVATNMKLQSGASEVKVEALSNRPTHIGPINEADIDADDPYLEKYKTAVPKEKGKSKINTDNNTNSTTNHDTKEGKTKCPATASTYAQKSDCNNDNDDDDDDFQPKKRPATSPGSVQKPLRIGSVQKTLKIESGDDERNKTSATKKTTPVTSSTLPFMSSERTDKGKAKEGNHFSTVEKPPKAVQKLSKRKVDVLEDTKNCKQANYKKRGIVVDVDDEYGDYNGSELEPDYSNNDDDNAGGNKNKIRNNNNNDNNNNNNNNNNINNNNNNNNNNKRNIPSENAVTWKKDTTPITAQSLSKPPKINNDITGENKNKNPNNNNTSNNKNNININNDKFNNNNNYNNTIDNNNNSNNNNNNNNNINNKPKNPSGNAVTLNKDATPITAQSLFKPRKIDDDISEGSPEKNNDSSNSGKRPPGLVALESALSVPQRLQEVLPPRDQFKEMVQLSIRRLYTHFHEVIMSANAQRRNLPCVACYISNYEVNDHLGKGVEVFGKCRNFTDDRCFVCLGSHKKSECALLSSYNYTSGTCCFRCSLPEKDEDFHFHSNDRDKRLCKIKGDYIRSMAMAKYQFDPLSIETKFFAGRQVSIADYRAWLARVADRNDPCGAYPFLNMVKVFVFAIEEHHRQFITTQAGPFVVTGMPRQGVTAPRLGNNFLSPTVFRGPRK